MLLDPQSCCQLCLCWTPQTPEGFSLQRRLALALRAPCAARRSLLAPAGQSTPCPPCRAASPCRGAGLGWPWLSWCLCFLPPRVSSCSPWSSTHPWNTTTPMSTHPGATCWAGWWHSPPWSVFLSMPSSSSWKPKDPWNRYWDCGHGRVAAAPQVAQDGPQGGSTAHFSSQRQGLVRVALLQNAL